MKMNVNQVIKELKLNDNALPTEKVKRLLKWHATYVTDSMLHLGKLIESQEIKILTKGKIEEIATLAAKSRGETVTDLQGLVFDFWGVVAEVEEGRYSEGKYKGAYFGKPTEILYTGEDVYKLGILPNSCLTHAIMAFDVLDRILIESYAIWMTQRDQSGGHAVNDFIVETGKQRADFKWELKDGGKNFFRGREDLYHEFKLGAMRHGTRFDQNGRLKEYDNQQIIRRSSIALH